MQFKYLTVIGEAPPLARKDGGFNRMITCRCKCGSVKDVVVYTLIHRGYFSCGCYKRSVTDKCRKRVATNKTLNLAEYHTWRTMKRRCLSKKDKSYSNYGGRGVTVCKEWIESFDKFLLDMGKRPSDKHSLDRIDNNGDYEPSNCRWATMLLQSRNKRTNRFIEFNGERRCIKEWADIIGLSTPSLSKRIANGWPLEKALTTPSMKCYNRFK